MQTPFGNINLKRWPPSSDRSLQAWDAADELLLAHVHEHHQSALTGKAGVLVCNDSHGALGCALHASKPVNWSDSSLAHQALKRNWTSNELPDQPDCLDSLSTPAAPFALVLIKVPKTYALLEEQLARIRPVVDEHTVILAASLIRHLHRTAFGLFEKYIGDVTTSLAVKKARLVFCRLDVTLPVLASPYPDEYSDADLQMTLTNHASVFCRDRVDIGARFFLSHSAKLPQAHNIVDLACGNGILGIYAQRLQPGARLHFIDESYMAVASASVNYMSLIPDAEQQPVFTVGNGLEQREDDSTELILCNPPFHAQHAVADDTARAFFKHAARCLRAQGQLWVVANKQLRYKSYLQRHFKHSTVVADNRKFMLIKSWS